MKSVMHGQSEGCADDTREQARSRENAWVNKKKTDSTEVPKRSEMENIATIKGGT